MREMAVGSQVGKTRSGMLVRVGVTVGDMESLIEDMKTSFDVQETLDAVAVYEYLASRALSPEGEQEGWIWSCRKMAEGMRVAIEEKRIVEGIAVDYDLNNTLRLIQIGKKLVDGKFRK